MSYTLVMENEDPYTYKKVVESLDSDRCLQEMIEEIQSLKKN